MSLPFEPLPIVFISIEEAIFSLSMLEIIFPFTNICFVIFPCVFALPMLHVVFPLALIYIAICEAEHSVAIHLIFIVHAVIGRLPVSKGQLPLAMFLIIFIHSFINISTGILESPVTVLLVHLPLSHVELARHETVCPLTMSSVLLPLAVVQVSIGKDKLSVSIAFVIFVGAVVFVARRKPERTFPVKLSQCILLALIAQLDRTQKRLQLFHKLLNLPEVPRLREKALRGGRLCEEGICQRGEADRVALLAELLRAVHVMGPALGVDGIP
mmetsp:Transcript_12745/g.20750  ORF Transcript_12745/g.20750 Transcript_12745/m.20750 type:complete len:270 (+) Transcript_12745:1253-2062(+)